MIPALEALKRLQEGNARFVAGEDLHNFEVAARRNELVAGQAPFAVVLGCSDSRVPAELVFDQGLGDLFVIRVAGNVVAPTQLGSVEFAAASLGTRLVVVKGHSQCGAVSATLKELKRPTFDLSENLGAILDRVRPAVANVLENAQNQSDQEVMHQAVRANIRTSVDSLFQQSAILKRLVAEDGLLIVGAEYALETGQVDFFYNMPDA